MTYITTADACQLLGISRQTFWRRCRPRLTAYRPTPGCVRYRLVDVLALAEGGA